MVNKTIQDDLLIQGEPQSSVAKIKTVPEKTLELSGPVNIADSETGTSASLSIGGVDIVDYIGTTDIITADATLTNDQTFIVAKRPAGDSGDITITLPQITTTAKKFYITFEGDLRAGAASKDAYWIMVKSSLDITGSDPQSGDTFDGRGKDSGIIWTDNYGLYTHHGSIMIQSVVGLNPGVGTGNGWKIMSSHFEKREGFKHPVRVASTVNETLSNLVPGYSVDGKTLGEYERVLLKNQTDASENGIYIIQPSGDPFRSEDFQEDSYQAGSHIHVVEGTLNAFRTYAVTNPFLTSKVGTDDLDIVQGSGTSSWKNPVLIASTGSNLTLSGYQTIDGHTLSGIDTILVKDQTNPVENGVYITGSGSWARNASWGDGKKTNNWSVWVEKGTTNKDTAWVVTNDSGNDVIGTDALNFAEFSKAAGGADTHVQFNNSGVISGSSDLVWDGSALGITGDIILNGSTSGSLTLDVPATVTDYTITLPSAVGTNGQILETDGSGNLSWVTPSSGGSVAGSDTEIQFNNSGSFGASSDLTWDGSALGITGDIVMNGSTSGSLTIDVPAAVTDYTITLPSAIGTNGQILETDGSGNLSWVTPSSGGTPAGSDTEIQFNNAGSFGASSDLAWDGTALSAPQIIVTDKGTVTQTTSLSTGVTLNKPAGVITLLSGGSISSDAVASFTVTNSYVSASSVVIVTMSDGPYQLICNTRSVTSGSFDVGLYNADNGTQSTTNTDVHFVVL